MNSGIKSWEKGTRRWLKLGAESGVRVIHCPGFPGSRGLIGCRAFSAKTNNLPGDHQDQPEWTHLSALSFITFSPFKFIPENNFSKISRGYQCGGQVHTCTWTQKCACISFSPLCPETHTYTHTHTQSNCDSVSAFSTRVKNHRETEVLKGRILP